MPSKPKQSVSVGPFMSNVGRAALNALTAPSVVPVLQIAGDLAILLAGWPSPGVEYLTKNSTMSTLQQQNEHTAPIADSVRRSAGWCSRSAFLVAFRAAQLVSTITALGLLAFLVDYGSHGSFELAVSVISLTYLVVIASATLPLNLYALTAVSVFEAAVFALWVAASATLGSRYSQYSCTIHAPKDDGDFYYGVWDYLHALSKECKVGQASIAFAAFSAFLSLCALCLLCVNVLAPMNAVFVGEVRPEGTRAHLRRFTALAVACAPGTANNDVETPAPVTVEAVNPVTEHA